VAAPNGQAAFLFLPTLALAPLMRLSASPFFERAHHVLDAGFLLMDIVDPAYYGRILWQVDCVFVRHDLVVSNPELLPFEAEGFKFAANKWSHFT